MFRRPPDALGRALRFTLDGEALLGREGDTVAAAMLASGRRSFRRTAVSGAERGPWCMMGVCHDCLVVLDGVASTQACLVPLCDSMAVRTQQGRREVET